MRKALWLSLPLLFMALTLSADPQAPKKKTPPAAVDLYGDPLPEGVLARLGTVKWRHAGQLQGVQFADDDKTLVSNGIWGFAVGIWDAATGRLKHKNIGSICLHIAVSPNGKIIVTDLLQLIDIKTGQEIRRLGPPPNELNICAFSPDSKIVAAAEYMTQPPQKITLWDVDTGKELHKIEGHPEEVKDLAFSTDGKMLAIGGDHHAIRYWDVATGKLTRQLETPGKQVLSLAFSPDGKMLASIDDEGVISVWDSTASKVLRSLNIEKQEVYKLAFSPDGKLLASLGQGQRTHLWDPQTGKEIRQWPDKVTGQSSFSADGKMLASYTGNTIRRWDSATHKEIDPPTGHTARTNSLQFSPLGHTLISQGKDKAIIEWDLATLRLRRSIFSESMGPNSKYHLWSIADYSPAADLLAIGSAYSRVGPKDDLKPELAVPLWNTTTGKASHVLVGHTDRPERAKFSSDGKYLASSARDGVRLWDVMTGKQAHHWPGSSRLVCFTPDGKRLIINGPDKVVRFWDVETKKEGLAWDSANSPSANCCFSADQRFIASVNPDVMRVWEVDSGKEFRAIRQPSSTPLQDGALSPTGRIAAIAIRDKHKLANGEYEQMATIKLVETITGDEIRRMVVPHTILYSLAFSPDGRLLASDGGDSTILFWDMTGQAELGTLGKFKERQELKEPDLIVLWADLAGDAAKAEKALWTLAFASKQSMAFLKDHMQPRPAANGNEVAKLIAALDSPSFAGREKAAEALEKLGETAEAAVRKHLEGKTTLESRQRLQQFIQQRDKDAIRKLRAVESVEQIGTPAASELLQSIAKESPNLRVAEAAAGALERLDKRRK